jgi:hypothetical protein
LANPEIYYCVKPRPIQERESPWERPPVLRTVEGLLRPCRMRETPYHGLNFCQGTTAEMLDDPAREIFEVIRWFGERGKIFNVHFRNIKGRSSTLWRPSPMRATWTCPAPSPLIAMSATLKFIAGRDLALDVPLFLRHAPGLPQRRALSS